MLSTIQTSRLILQDITEADVLDIHTSNSFPQVAAFNTIGIPRDIDVTYQQLQALFEDIQEADRSNYGWTIRLAASGTFVGEIGMKLSVKKYQKAEIYYSLHPDHWGNGYATEALEAVLSFGFGQLKLHRIEAGVATGNTASIRVLERVGMLREGCCRKILPIRGDWYDNYMYAMLEEDYYHKKQQPNNFSR